MGRRDPWKLSIARRLRREATDAERRLWYQLRSFPEAHWRRQHPLQGYVVDFYSSIAKLAVEVDGGQHFEPMGLERDRQRDELLRDLGIRVLRFGNEVVLQRTDEVAEEIWRIWNARVREEGRDR